MVVALSLCATVTVVASGVALFRIGQGMTGHRRADAPITTEGALAGWVSTGSPPSVVITAFDLLIGTELPDDPPPAPPIKLGPVTAQGVPLPVKPKSLQKGIATWFPAPKGTCAHRTLPMGTVVTVYMPSSNAIATCKVNDRGPFGHGRIIDLSPDTFAKLARTTTGVLDVRILW